MGIVTTVLLVVAQLTPTVSAHSGTTHAGTPHWILLALTLTGLAAVCGCIVGVRRGLLDPHVGATGGLVGFIVGGLGGVGLVEMQVVAEVGPKLAPYYPIASFLIGSSVMVGSVVAGRFLWPTRLDYTLLGVSLGAWIVYPAVMPNQGILHPLGYVLVFAVPALIVTVLRRDASPLIGRVLSDAAARRVGALTFVCVGIFLAFSAGTVTLNPDDGVNKPAHRFVTTLDVADPLVMWPAVEFFYPSIPLSGMISVGTLLLFSFLAGLVALNAATITAEWRAGRDGTSARTLGGMVATTGATACCCCAPAMYGVISAVFGTAATPAYWAFMDSSSPVSASFLALSVALLTASLVRSSATENAARCGVLPREAAAD